MSKKSVIAAYNKSKKEHNRLDDILNLMRKTQIGKESLNALEGSGYGFLLESGIDDFGFCDPTIKKIVLNASLKPETLVAVLSHEIRHAIQFGKNPKAKTISSMQTGDFIKCHRAMEADACAHQAAFVYEAKKAGMAVEMPEGYESIFETYSAELNKTKNKKQAMNAAFKAWYKDVPIMDWYDNHYTSSIRNVVNYLIALDQKNQFKGKQSDQKCSDVLVYKGKPYVEPEFFSSPEVYCLRRSDKRKIMNAMKKYAQKTGAPLDASVLGMADRNEKVVQNNQKNRKKTNNSVAAALFDFKAKQR